VRKKFYFILVIFLLVPVYSVYSDDEAPAKTAQDFWISLGGDASMYSYTGMSYGGSLSFGYGSGSSIGLKLSYFFNEESIDTFEICLLLRFYILGKNAYSGPFFQFLGGASLFNRSGDFAIPSNVGIFSAGLGFGWRFLFADRFFIEPFIRGGFPYAFGGTVSVGVRF